MSVSEIDASNRVGFQRALVVSAARAFASMRIYYSEIIYLVNVNILLADNIFRRYTPRHAKSENYCLGLPVRTVQA